jgi:outer membrane protein OmpA-like peptidoglycan-associated protein
MEAQGYGEQYPVADNATAAGRAQNRRIAMNVTQK